VIRFGTYSQVRKYEHTTAVLSLRVESSIVLNKMLTSTPSAGKVLETVFWNMHGIILLEFTSCGTAVKIEAFQETLT
jgi:hypothetical protein